MKILYASSEIVPFAKTGGLADVAGSLPKALKDIGHDVRVILPKYQMVDDKKFGLKLIFEGLDVQVGDTVEKANIYESKIPGSDVTAYFVGNPKYFDRKELYQVAGVDYEDNCERFTFFSKAVINFLKRKGWQPHIVHCNDWQSALIIAYIKALYKDDSFFSKIATVYSIHNMGYQGVFPKEKILVTGLGWDTFVPEKLEFYGNIALTKAGFVFADVINTVSEQYAKEIQTPEYGSGLEGLLKLRTQDVYGIVNGIDYDVWDPAKDDKIFRKYSPNTLSLKVENKLDLQKINNLPQKKDIPVMSMIGRLADQKGLDILAGALEEIMHLKLQFVVLGTGEPKYHELLQEEKRKYPDHVGLNLGFDAVLAQKIYAGSDMFIMPSRYEPCGLGQLISFKYGTIPVVRKTGGLADTVKDYDPKTQEGDGFVFEDYSSTALLDAVKRAVEAYRSKKTWASLVKKVVKYDFSWTTSAKKYVSLYKKALEKVGL